MPRRPAVALTTAAVVMIALAACTTDEPEESPVTIGVAAAPSLSGAFTELIEVFEAERPGVRVHLELGRSGEIAEALADRTDLDVFASAGDDAMALAVDRATVTDPEIFARNHVVLAVPSGNPAGVTGLTDLSRSELRVGLCEQEAPCGKAADVLLDEAGVAPAVDARGAGSRALTASLGDNEFDAGIVYRTDVAASYGWVARVAVDSAERELTQEAGATRYILARVSAGGGSDDADPDTEAEDAAADEFRALVTSERGKRALEGAGLQPLSG